MEFSQLDFVNELKDVLQKFPPKFKLGDLIVSKKTGLPVVGTIISVKMAQLYIMENKGVMPQRWNTLFPNWPYKSIYVVALDEKIPNLSIEEFNQYKQNGFLEEFNTYEDLPKFGFIEYVEDDIELF